MAAAHATTRRRARSLWLGALAAGLTLGLAPAAAEAAPQVRIVAKGGDVYVFDFAEHEGGEDIKDREYTIRSSPSAAAKRNVTGFSLHKVLQEGRRQGDGKPFDHISFGYLEIPRPGSGKVLLSNSQVRSHTEFPDGPPVIYAEGGDVHFLRPSAGTGDANAADDFAVSGTLTVLEGEGNLIRVEASASKNRIKAGETVRLSATATGGSGQALTYRWSYVGGPSKQGASVRYRLDRPGRYFFVVTVEAPNGDFGNSDPVEVRVGKIPEDKDKPRSGGGKNDDSTAPDSGPVDGPGGTPGNSGPGGADGPGSEQPQASQDRAPSPPPGEPVEGELLDEQATDTQAPEPEAASSDAGEQEAVAARTGQLDPDSGLSVPGAAVGLLLTAGLVGAGAARELDGHGMRAAREWWTQARDTLRRLNWR